MNLYCGKVDSLDHNVGAPGRAQVGGAWGRYESRLGPKLREGGTPGGELCTPHASPCYPVWFNLRDSEMLIMSVVFWFGRPTMISVLLDLIAPWQVYARQLCILELLLSHVFQRPK